MQVFACSSSLCVCVCVCAQVRVCTCAGVCVGVGFFCSIVVILCVGGGIVMVVMGVVNSKRDLQ